LLVIVGRLRNWLVGMWGGESKKDWRWQWEFVIKVKVQVIRWSSEVGRVIVTNKG